MKQIFLKHFIINATTVSDRTSYHYKIFNTCYYTSLTLDIPSGIEAYKHFYGLVNIDRHYNHVNYCKDGCQKGIRGRPNIK